MKLFFFPLICVVVFSTNCNRFKWTHESTDHPIDREIEELRKKDISNLPEENLIINIDTYEIDKTNLTLYQTAWKYVDDKIIIQGGQILSANGLRIAVLNDNFRTEWALSYSSTTKREKSSASLVVLSGTTGSIFVGEQIPIQTFFLWQSPGVLLQAYELRNVGFFLEVSPRIIQGNIIEVRIMPVVSHIVDGQPQRIKFTQLQTTLTVERGKQVIIGSYQDKDDTLGQTFFTSGSGISTKNRLIVLTVK